MTKIKTNTKIENLPPIGSFKPKNPFFMAPLAGVTDAPTRLIYSEMGAGIVYSEMVSAKGIHYGDKKSAELLDILYPADNEHSNLSGVAYQIFGSDPEIMAEAAENLDAKENDLIDVNMGCPVPKVFKNGDGSALLKNPELCEKIISSMKSKTEKPVTAKIRIGIDNSNINCIEVAKALEEGGADAICVHGRTREAYYSGSVDYRRIAEVKEAVSIPVIGNGDILTVEDALYKIEKYNVDGIAIGRGAIENPLIFSQIKKALKGEKYEELNFNQRIDILLRHLYLEVNYKGQRQAILNMRKTYAYYLKNLKNSKEIRNKLNVENDYTNVVKILEEYREQMR